MSPSYSTSRTRRRQRSGSWGPFLLLATLIIAAGAYFMLGGAAAPAAAPPKADAVLVGDAAGARQAFGSVMTTATQKGGEALLLEGPLTGGAPGYVIQDMRPTGGNDPERQADRNAKAKAAGDGFTRLSAAGQGSGTVLDGLHALDQQLRALTHSGADVVLLGSLVRPGGGVDLTDPVQRADTAASVGRVAASGLLPQCTGDRFYVVGGATSAGKPLDSLASLQLQEFYRQLFRRCGGQLVLWNDSQLPAFPVDTAVAAASWSKASACTALTIPLGADLLFDSGSATLRPEARPYLDKVLSSLLHDHPDGTVTITGYTDNVGPAAANQALSTRRAAAVARWFEQHGLAKQRVKAGGRGAAQPVAGNDSAEGRQLNRRVDISVSKPGAGCQGGGGTA